MSLRMNAGSLSRTATKPTPWRNDLLVPIACPLCDSPGSRFLMQGRDRLFGQAGFYAIVQCTACGMKYVNPRPTTEALKRHYPDDYLPVRLPNGKRSFMSRLGQAIMDLRWIAYTQLIERTIGRIPASATVVDVGCGRNDMLARLRRYRGCEGLAVDINPAVATYVRTQLRMPMFCGTLRDARLDSGSVDLVTMNEYLEHEPEPRAVLLEARRISRRGGHLVVEVPLMDSLTSRLFGSCWSQLDVPRHLAFYTPATLAGMLERCGYRVLHTKPFGVPFSIGISVLQSFGLTRLGRLRALDALLILLTGAPFLPICPWLHEFMLVVAQAE